jgi:hypothetical protein
MKSKKLAVFKSIYKDAPPNPFLILFILPVALFCVLISYLYERARAATRKCSNR